MQHVTRERETERKRVAPIHDIYLSDVCKGRDGSAPSLSPRSLPMLKVFFYLLWISQCLLSFLEVTRKKKEEEKEEREEREEDNSKAMESFWGNDPRMANSSSS